MPPICFLNQIFKLGITRGIERQCGKLIYVCIAALNASVPAVNNSTLPSSSQKRYQSREKTLKVKEQNKTKNERKLCIQKKESSNPESFKLK